VKTGKTKGNKRNATEKKESGVEGKGIQEGVLEEEKKKEQEEPSLGERGN